MAVEHDYVALSPIDRSDGSDVERDFQKGCPHHGISLVSYTPARLKIFQETASAGMA